MLQGGLPVRHADGHHPRRGELGRHDVRRLRRPAGRRRRQHHGQIRRHQAGAGVVPKGRAAVPADVFAWNDASNNKALISGQSALIMNSPSAWAVAKRDAPKIAEQLWTFQPPKGPKGRYDTGINRFWGIWNFSPNKAAAKSLLAYLSTRSSVEKLVNASQGYDVPPFEKLTDFDRLGRGGAAQGHALQSSAERRHDRLGDRLSGAAEARRADVLAGHDVQDDRQMHPGRPIDRRAIDYAQSELEGFLRT